MGCFTYCFWIQRLKGNPTAREGIGKKIRAQFNTNCTQIRHESKSPTTRTKGTIQQCL